MKRLIKNIVTKEEAEWIIDNKNNLSFDNKIIAKILSKLEEYMDKKVSLDERTHLRVEEATKERCHHPWHVDTGSLNHMSWCIYGVSILLNTDFEGGEFSYGIKESKDTNIVTEIIRPIIITYQQHYIHQMYGIVGIKYQKEREKYY